MRQLVVETLPPLSSRLIAHTYLFMKKSTSKAAKVTKTAAKPATKAPAKTVKKAAAPATKRTSAAKTAAAKAPAAKAPAVKAPSVKVPAAKTPATVITALIDVGFGNTLYLRGQGPGLSWDSGVPMECASDNKWTLALPGDGESVIYKFLINDLTWSAGPDYVADSGSKTTVEPTF
jgi:hypothetical protein